MDSNAASAACITLTSNLAFAQRSGAFCRRQRTLTAALWTALRTKLTSWKMVVRLVNRGGQAQS
jgi:hypothetical protein